MSNDLLIGRLAVLRGYISMDELAEATRVQGRLTGPPRLGEILVQLGALTEDQRDELLAAQKAQRDSRASLQNRSASRSTVLPADAGVGKPCNTPSIPAASRLGLDRQPGTALGPGFVGKLSRRAPALGATPSLPGAVVRRKTGSVEIAGLALKQVAVVEPPEEVAPAAPSPLEVRAALTPTFAVAPVPPAGPASVAVLDPHSTPTVRVVRQRQPVVAEAPPPLPDEVAVNVGRIRPRAPQSLDELDGMLAAAAEAGASDLHLHCGRPVQIRASGSLFDFSQNEISPPVLEMLLRARLPADRVDRLDRDGQVDFVMELPAVGRLRGNIYRQQGGLDAVFRIIPAEPPNLTDLGLDTTLARLTTYHNGLVLVTGPARSGKTSTLAALVDIINEERDGHLLTVEDPIEFRHPSKRCVVNQREVGVHTDGYGRAMRAALREDPDVVVLGELRDHETIALALSAAETGHLVMATLHTSGAIRTIRRVVGVFPPGQQCQVRGMLSDSLRAIVSQRLVRRANGHGLVPVWELLVVTKAVGALIREDKTHQIRSVMQTGTQLGMCLLDDQLADRVEKGTITREEALRNCIDARRFGPEE